MDNIKHDCLDKEVILSGIYSYIATSSVDAEFDFGVLIEKGGEHYPLNEHGFKALAKLIGSTPKFLSSLDFDIKEQVINSKLLDLDEPIIMRTVKGKLLNYNVRAFLKKGWQKFDNFDLVKSVETVAKANGLNITGFHVDDYTMDLRIAFDEGELSTEDISVGFSILNNECSTSPVLIDLLVEQPVAGGSLIVRQHKKNLAKINNMSAAGGFHIALQRVCDLVRAELDKIKSLIHLTKDYKFSEMELNTTYYRKMYSIPRNIIKDVEGDQSIDSEYKMISFMMRVAANQTNWSSKRRGEGAVGNLLLGQTQDSNEFLDNVFVTQKRGRRSGE